ncbi:MAG: FliG C-terminal domain-containing protein [Bacteroidales bacterium]|nr:FliG C-terminal domain-containing protein [Bacteroidales bacterium]
MGEKVKEKVRDTNIGDKSLNDIASMSNARIRELLRRVDIEELSVALQNASDDVRERILPNLGSRARKKYDQVQADLRKFKKSDIKKYTANIEKEIKNLFRK